MRADSGFIVGCSNASMAITRPQVNRGLIAQLDSSGLKDLSSLLEQIFSIRREIDGVGWVKE